MQIDKTPEIFLPRHLTLLLRAVAKADGTIVHFKKLGFCKAGGAGLDYYVESLMGLKKLGCVVRVKVGLYSDTYRLTDYGESFLK